MLTIRTSRAIAGRLSCQQVALALCLVGCQPSSVGAPCLPEKVPAGGFDARESYVETSSVQCETRVCIVHGLRGDPGEDCVGGEGHCAGPDEVDQHVYCSCRCAAADSDFPECECPGGFSCVDLVDAASDGIAGGYCVRDE